MHALGRMTSLRPWRRCAQEPGADAPRFALPDGRTVALAREGAALGEALVDPSALGLDLPPVAEAAFSAVMSHHDSAARKVAAFLGRHGTMASMGAACPAKASACVSNAMTLSCAFGNNALGFSGTRLSPPYT